MSTNPIEALLLAGAGGNRFPASSRYHGVATATTTLADGTPVAYLRRRFVPPPDSLSLLRRYRVQEGDRLDTLSAELLGDPELFWRIADGNAVLRPDALLEPVVRLGPGGVPNTEYRTLRITLPAGVPGVENG
jgi:hypothetical protein